MAQHHFDKHFSLEEAQSLIPAVQRFFGRIHDLLREPTVPAGQPEWLDPRVLAGRRPTEIPAEGPLPPDLPFEQHPVPPTQEGRRQEIEKLLRALVLRGIVIQDIWRGLIDFPHLLRGEREVLLCYELADGDRIQFFHDLHAGYAGRQPLEDE